MCQSGVSSAPRTNVRSCPLACRLLGLFVIVVDGQIRCGCTIISFHVRLLHGQHAAPSLSSLASARQKTWVRHQYYNSVEVIRLVGSDDPNPVRQNLSQLQSNVHTKDSLWSRDHQYTTSKSHSVVPDRPECMHHQVISLCAPDLPLRLIVTTCSKPQATSVPGPLW